MYNQGIIKTGEVFDLIIEYGLILSQNGVFCIENRELGHDRLTAIAALNRLGLAERLEQVIRYKLLGN